MTFQPAGIPVVNPHAGLDPTFVPPPEAVCLSEGKAYLFDGVVYRPTAPWTQSVHALLRHLEDARYRGAPRLIGDGIDANGRQIMRHIEGEPVHPYPWSDQGVHEVGRLLREMHDTTRSFYPPDGAQWMPWYTHRPGSDPVIGHGDTGPWNIIAQDGIPVAFVDWDFAGPVERLDEVAEAIRLNCQLHGDDVAALRDLPSPEARAYQVGLFADAYGLDDQERGGLVDRMVEWALRGAANDVDEAVITHDFTGPHPMVWGVAWQARGGRWILEHRQLLNQALGVRP